MAKKTKKTKKSAKKDDSGKKTKIKHIDPKLSKENQKHMNDLMQLKLPIIQEMNQINDEQSKFIELEADGTETSLQRKSAGIRKAGYSPVYKKIDNGDVDTAHLAEDDPYQKLEDMDKCNDDNRVLRFEEHSNLEDSLEMPDQSKPRISAGDKFDKDTKESSFNMKTLNGLISFTPVITNKAKSDLLNFRGSLETQYLSDSINNADQLRGLKQENNKTDLNSYEYDSPGVEEHSLPTKTQKSVDKVPSENNIKQGAVRHGSHVAAEKQ